MPGPPNANASDVAISTKWHPAAGGLQRLYLTVYTGKVFPHSANNHFILLSNNLDFEFCTEVNLSPVATAAVAFLEGPRVSTGGSD